MRTLTQFALLSILLLSPFTLDARQTGGRRRRTPHAGTQPTRPARTEPPAAWKFDEFNVGVGSPESRQWWVYQKYEEAELKRRLRLYAAELRRAGARPYAITYGPRVVPWEIYNRSIAGMRGSELWPYLTPLGFDWRKINWVNGGFRERAATELWIVPPGAQPPCPTPTVRPEDVSYCPRVSVATPPYVPDSRRLSFEAAVAVNNDNRVQPTFTWDVSRGRILSGQGTNKIEVEEEEGSSGEVLARVVAHGYSLDCPLEESVATARTTFATSHFKFDSFGKISCEDELARLDSLAIELQNDPRLQVHVVVYGGKQGPRNEALARAARMKVYLVKSRAIDESRVIAIDGGYRGETEGELWLSRTGAGAPPVRPTIDARHVKLKGSVDPSAVVPCDTYL